MGHHRLAVLDVIQSRCVKKGKGLEIGIIERN